MEVSLLLFVAGFCSSIWTPSSGLNIEDTCNVDVMDVCPVNSHCLPRGCDGHVCLCDEDHVPNPQLTVCQKAVDLGQSCIDDASKCKAPFSYCEPLSHECSCFPGFVPSLDNLRCKSGPMGPIAFALLGEPCGALTMCSGLFLVCNTSLTSPVCECSPHSLYREATDTEKDAEPFSPLECRPIDYTLDAAVEELDCVEEEPPLESSINEECYSFNNCPPNSDCVSRGCDGKVCVCKAGFYPSADKNECLRVLSLGDDCSDNTTVCIREGIETQCLAGTCQCLDFMEERNDRCRLSHQVLPPSIVLKFSLLNETCETKTGVNGVTYFTICSELFTECRDGMCRCQTQFRPASEAEMDSDPERVSNCVQDSYSLDVDLLVCDRLKQSDENATSPPTTV